MKLICVQKNFEVDLSMENFKKKLKKHYKPKNITFKRMSKKEIDSFYLEGSKIKDAYNIFIDNKKTKVVLSDEAFNYKSSYTHINPVEELFYIISDEIDREIKKNKKKLKI